LELSLLLLIFAGDNCNVKHLNSNRYAKARQENGAIQAERNKGEQQEVHTV
jgi:hypothetical protein